MKLTNIKQLIIKFMGGGIINFPTRFLKWIKIDGDIEDSDDSGSGGSTEIDYEAIYQFYKKKVIEYLPEEVIEQAIIPEHYADIEKDTGSNEEYRNRPGIWYSIDKPTTEYLFCEIIDDFVITKYIYFGDYTTIK